MRWLGNLLQQSIKWNAHALAYEFATFCAQYIVYSNWNVVLELTRMDWLQQLDVSTKVVASLCGLELAKSNGGHKYSVSIEGIKHLLLKEYLSNNPCLFSCSYLLEEAHAKQTAIQTTSLIVLHRHGQVKSQPLSNYKFVCFTSKKEQGFEIPY